MLHILKCVIIHIIHTTDYGFKRLIQDLRYILSSRLKLNRTAPLFGYQNGLKCTKNGSFMFIKINFIALIQIGTTGQ